MKISLNWLSDYLDLSDYYKKPDVLAEVLTKAGLEVEGIENKSKDFENVVIGLILEKDKHPNADKLSLCRVTTGQGIVHQIVCGAQNHKTGDRVIVALPGALLPGNFAIQKSVIRSVESYGMLCSYKELGMADTSDGIAILDSEAPVGTAFADYKGLNDVVFEIKVTPNRADVLSHFGLARELSCLLNKSLKVSDFQKEMQENTKWMIEDKSTKQKIQLTVEDNTLCPRYSGRFLARVKVGPSPEWLKQRLEILGLKSINNIVDVTNFVLQDLGQPLHAFDADKIDQGTLKVGHPIKDEKFTTLDGTELILTGEELSIKDKNQKTLCLAGVIGGKNSGVVDETQNLFLESAYFLSHSVRKTSRLLGVESESAYRFSRGVDPQITLEALNRAAFLIQKIAGGEVYGDHYDIYPSPVGSKTITIQLQTLTDRLGFEAKADKLVSWLERLFCKVEKISEVEFRITPPSFRVDLETEMDLVEEYARLEGYELIPESIPPLHSKPSAHDPTYINMIKTYGLLKSFGFNHAFNYSFLAEKDLKKQNLDKGFDFSGLGLEKFEMLVKLKNPLNEDLNVMRPLLFWGLFKNALTNLRYGNEAGKLFEVGKVFHSKNGASIEKMNMGIITWGNEKDLWGSQSQAPQIYCLKEAVENLLKEFKIKSFAWKQAEFSKVNELNLPEFAHPYQTAVLIVEGRKRGYISSVHPMLLEEEKVRVPVAFGEFDFDGMLPAVARVKRVTNISRFPIVERDLSLVMDKYQPIDLVFETIKKAAGKTLLKMDVFDVYEGEKLDTGKKSVALRIKLQDHEKTLEEAQVNQLQEQILIQLKTQYGIHLR
ncbi:MAG: phenylalanine--tRNA ligase subunit beta [Bdellovibrionaceae bacterium]|nr:phenylalanine--tRNA ligase subunit beta [Pseudobdellovibrionaceae bacterium]